MVQILPQVDRSGFSSEFGRSVGAGASQGFAEARAQKQQLAQIAKENALIKQNFGIDLTGVNNPETRKTILAEQLKGLNKQNILEQKNKSFADIINSPDGQEESQTYEGDGFSQDNQIPESAVNPNQESNKPKSKAKKFTDKQILAATNIDPNLGREMRMANDEAFREERHQNESERKRFESDRTYNENLKKEARKEQLAFHAESSKYDEELFKQAKIAKKQVDIIKDSEKAINSGKVKPSSLANMFKGLGPIGDKLSNALLNKDEAVILSAIPEFLEGRKELFGVRLSDADLRLLQDKLPDIGKSPESNKAILRIMRKYAEASQLRHDIAKDIKKENKGLRPLGYAEMVEGRYDEMVKPVRVINPNNGNVIEIPTYELGDAIKAGATIYNE